jgi:broad specificity phosphatase PhoE
VTTVILIRHAHSVANEKGVLAGQAPGIGLSRKGLVQAQELRNRLGNLKCKDIRISPLERCAATLEPWLELQKSFRKLVAVDSDVSESVDVRCFAVLFL